MERGTGSLSPIRNHSTRRSLTDLTVSLSLHQSRKTECPTAATRKSPRALLAFYSGRWLPLSRVSRGRARKGLVPSAAQSAGELHSVPSSGKTRDEIEDSLSASAVDMTAVTDFAQRYGLTVLEVSCSHKRSCERPVENRRGLEQNLRFYLLTDQLRCWLTFLGFWHPVI
jgi:hypothetical protein